jgi:hypothetical protein
MNQFDPIFFTPPNGDTKRARRLYKGGGGGDGGAAARQAAEDARVAQAVRKLNEVFGLMEATPDPVDQNQFMIDAPIERTNTTNVLGLPMYQGGNAGAPSIGNYLGGQPATRKVLDTVRYNAAVQAAKAKADALKGAAQKRESLYSKIGDDAKATALLDLNKDREDTERELGFMLARQGLSGGSRDIDVNREILDTNQQGILKATNLGLQIANDARSNDDKTRVNLINSIRAGLDQGSAQQQAYEGMRNNAASAADAAKATSLAGFFDTLRNRQQQAAYSQGFDSTIQQQKTTPKTSAVNGDRGRTAVI